MTVPTCRPGEHVLIHGGAGGTGHVAVQLAALQGARVAATVSSPEKARIVARSRRRAGHQLPRSAISPRRRSPGPAGINVAFDNAGAEVMQKTYRAMAPYGRVVTLMGVAPTMPTSTPTT